MHIACFEERGQGFFQEAVAANIDHPSQLCCLPDEISRCDHIAYAQGWGQGFGERSDVDDLTVVACAGQREDGAAGVVEIVVIVVFYDRELVLVDELEEAHPPVAAKGNRGGVVMVGDDVQQVRCLFPDKFFDEFDVHAVVVHGNPYQVGAKLPEYGICHEVIGAAYQDFGTGADDHSGCDEDGHLGASCDDDVIEVEGHSSCVGEEVDNGVAQVDGACLLAQHNKAFVGGLVEQPPVFSQEQVDGGDPGVGEAIVDDGA